MSANRGWKRVAEVTYALDLAGTVARARQKAVHMVLGSIRRTREIRPAQDAPATALIVRHYVEAAGLYLCAFAEHSLWAGLLTSVAEPGADVLRMMGYPDTSARKPCKAMSGVRFGY